MVVVGRQGQGREEGKHKERRVEGKIGGEEKGDTHEKECKRNGHREK